MIASRGTNMTLTIARIRPNRDAIRDAANEAQHYEIEDCPTHGAVRIRALVDFPSMMGYGTDSVTTFTCGCTHSDTPMGR